MKKATDQREPSASSLRDIPPVDLSKLKPGKRNPFARRMHEEGWTLAHESPSRASVHAIPELARDAIGQVNPYATRLKAKGVELQVGRRRPRAGTEVGPTKVKSVRLPPAVWKRLQQQARAQGTTLHALIRSLLLQSLDDSSMK